VFYSSLWEGLIGRNWLGNLESVPGLATAWRRLDERTVELTLRQNVRFHNGDEMTAEDVVFSFGPERMFGTGAPGQAAGGTLFARIPGQARRARNCRRRWWLLPAATGRRSRRSRWWTGTPSAS
jgi:peptide/nickel transport system substrate-binding protein